MASSSSGLTYSPQALDPYAVETTLAKEAYEGAGNASQQRLLDSYWYERQANKNVYGQEVEANRQLQQAQMQNALREKYLALYKDADPGLIDVINQQGGFYGADPGNMYQWAAQKAEAERHSKLGGAASGYSTAGMTPEALTTNLGVQGFGMRPDMQIAMMKEAGANARAAASAHGEKAPWIPIPIPGTENMKIIDDTGNLVRPTVRVRANASDQEVQFAINQARRFMGMAQPETSGVPGVPAAQTAMPGGGGQSTGAVGGGTSLGPNPNKGKGPIRPQQQQQTTAAQPSSQRFAPGTKYATDQESQARARAGLRTLPTSTQQFYAQNTKFGNNIPVASHNGRMHYINPDMSVGPAVP